MNLVETESDIPTAYSTSGSADVTGMVTQRRYLTRKKEGRDSGPVRLITQSSAYRFGSCSSEFANLESSPTRVASRLRSQGRG